MSTPRKPRGRNVAAPKLTHGGKQAQATLEATQQASSDPTSANGEHTRPPLPPEAYRPFLDGLADLLASEAISRITVVPGTRHHRNQHTLEGNQAHRDDPDNR